MATTTVSKLVLTFNTTEGKKDFTISDVNPSVTSAQIVDFATAVLTNGEDVFDPRPLLTLAAKVSTTTTTDMDIDG